MLEQLLSSHHTRPDSWLLHSLRVSMLTIAPPAVGVLLCLSSGLSAFSGLASPICSPYSAVYL